MSVPIHQRMYDEILSRINSAVARPGDKLPSERQLVKDFKASNTSVRRALSLLAEGGYIVKRHGSGNYVGDKVAASGADATNPDIVLVMPSSFGINAGLPELHAKLSAALPDLKLRVLSLETSSLEPEQARRLLELHRKPLLVLNTRNQTAALARQGLLAPLEALPAMADRLDRIPEHLKWRFQGANGVPRFFGCPYLYSTAGLAVNLDLAEAASLDLSQPPRIWSELITWGRRFAKWSAATGHHELHPFFGYHKSFFENSGSFYFMAMNGAPWAAPGEELRRGLGEYFRFVEDILAEGMAETVSIQAPDPFVSGKYLFHLQGGSWLQRDANRFRPEMRWKSLPFPAPGPNRPRFSMTGTQLLSLLLPEGHDTLAATRLLDTLHAPQLCCDLAWRFGQIPSDSAVARDYVRLRPEMEFACGAIFTGIEPHCPTDELRWGNINELLMRRLDTPSLHLEDMVDEHIAFVAELSEH